ncbi:MAG TPA: FAD:protein FMN transferase, partial [Methylomirabilota bacterium]|nr:FAD:protein FMN transferase [Methylomirabilota bacterium]
MACQTPPPGGRDAPPAPGITGAAAEIRHLVTRSRPLLGTFVVIAVAGTDRLRLNAAITDALAEIERVDAVMSVHRPDSELSRLNARAAHEPVVVSEELFRLIARAQEIAVATDGSFDVTIWPLTDLWGFLWKEHRLPSAEELRQTLPRVSFRLLSLDAATRTVHFRRRGMSLDLGGIAKGFAVDCAIEKLKSLGVTNALVRAGGDLRAIGDAPGQAGWLVQLEDPGKQGRRTSVRLREAAISTSGNYENYFE